MWLMVNGSGLMVNNPSGVEARNINEMVPSSCSVMCVMGFDSKQLPLAFWLYMTVAGTDESVSSLFTKSVESVAHG